MKKVVIMVLMLVVVVIMELRSFAPQKIYYDGFLAKKGIPVSSYTAFEFRITNQDGTEEYWSSGSTTIYVSNGMFRYPLGVPPGDTPYKFSEIDWESGSKYLEITVDGVTLAPRMEMLSEAYAINADKIDGRDYEAFVSTEGDTMNGGLDINESDTTKSYILRARRGNNYGLYVSTTGNVGIGTTNPTAKLYVVGKSTFTEPITVNGVYNASVPRGFIGMYSGPWNFDATGLGTGDLEGWALCNGNNGTPDLSDRFVFCSTSSITQGDTGGSSSHSHGVGDWMCQFRPVSYTHLTLPTN